MVELITNLNEVSKQINTNVKRRFLSVTLNYDGYKHVAPKIAKIGDKRILMTRHIELGNIEAQRDIDKSLPADFGVVFYNPYFTFETPKVPALPDFIDAFKEIAKGETKVTVHKDLPISLYQILAKEYETVLAPGEVSDPGFWVYEVSRQDVLNRFNLKRSEADKVALNLVAKSPLRDEFKKYIDNRTDSRFETLDGMMKEEGLDAVLCTSPLGVQELTGLGITRHDEEKVAALYLVGEDKVYLFSSESLADYEGAKKADSFFATVKSIVGSGALGLEEQHFPVGWLKELGFEDLNVKNSMALLKRSRETRAWEDLAYYIIATRTSVYATEGALEWTKKAIEDGKRVTELDVEKKYEELLEEFKEQKGIPTAINTFWTNCHAGARSLHASLAANHVLDKSAKTLKIDAGVSLLGDTGIHHAASDIARTLIFVEEAQKACDMFDSYMVKDVIPNLKPGMSGKDVYNLAVSRVEKDKAVLQDIGMMPKVDKLAPIFNRDVGHLMGLQEPVTLFFTKTAEPTIAEGMVGAIEYQWPIKDCSIGTEDLFIVGPKGGLNFSRDEL